MSGHEFQVVVSGYRSTVEEWNRAMNAPTSELGLNELTPDEKAVAERFGMSVERYARAVLAGRYGKKRLEDKGRALGELVSQILSGVDIHYHVRAVIWEIDRLRWMLRIEIPSRVVGVPVSFELADDAVDSGVLAEIDRLRVTVLEGIGRGDLVIRKAG